MYDSQKDGDAGLVFGVAGVWKIPFNFEVAAMM